MKELKEYSSDEIKSLYKRLDLYLCTQYIKCELKNAERPIVRKTLWQGDKSSLPDWRGFLLDLHKENAERDLLNEKNLKKCQMLQAKINYCSIASKALWYFASDWMKVFDEEKDLDDSKPMEPKVAFDHLIKHFPEQLDELTINDSINKQYNRATDYETYLFFWETLQYCSNEEIDQLLKMADKGLSTKWETIDISRNSGKKKKVQISTIMPHNKCIKYGFCIDQTFESQNELIEFARQKTGNQISLNTIARWKKTGYMKEVK